MESDMNQGHNTEGSNRHQRMRSNDNGSSPPHEREVNCDSLPGTVFHQGRQFIAPNTTLAKAVSMGNQTSSVAAEQESRRTVAGEDSSTKGDNISKPRPVSNLTMLLNQQNMAGLPSVSNASTNVDEGADAIANVKADSPLRTGTDLEEADSASGPSVAKLASSYSPSPPQVRSMSRQSSTGGMLSLAAAAATASQPRGGRHFSSRDLLTLAPPSGSPYEYMLTKKEELEVSMRHRLQFLRGTTPSSGTLACTGEQSDASSSTASKPAENSNTMRNKRRAQHAKAVVDDLCDVVTDLFIAESKLLNPMLYGLMPGEQKMTRSRREQVLQTVRSFVSSLPLRYALGADTPSEVLLHMRLMAVARSDRTKVAVHIHSLEDDSNWTRSTNPNGSKASAKSLRLVTICCNDAVGLLEYITKLLASGGSRVLDADVELSSDGLVLDRFVVDMQGRLRLDRLSALIECFLEEHARKTSPIAEGKEGGSNAFSGTGGGPLYHHQSSRSYDQESQDIAREMTTAVPLSEVLAASSPNLGGDGFTPLQRHQSMPLTILEGPVLPSVRLPMRRDMPLSPPTNLPTETSPSRQYAGGKQRRRMVNRPAISNLDDFEQVSQPSIDFVTVPTMDGMGDASYEIPVIPFEELMLIKPLGTGRISTIYRAAWRRGGDQMNVAAAGDVTMVALKVAMVDSVTGDTAHVDELRREADIAARLWHPNVVELVGVAADSDCFCLAYNFCEGGSLFSLLADSSRYYEYLPIALDVANGMAYLHSRNVIHRDLKPSNILLTKDHRAVIGDFGMSVANRGQELTAETGTYRYMAPEVIRHSPYSSNADVYSFGICLWQLITREVPFATMTPIQAAYAVAEGRRPEIPSTVPRRLQEIIMACWDQDSHRRPSFTYITMALADYARMAFSPANVGTQTLQIANEMLANVEGNSTVNVDISTHIAPFAGGASAPTLSESESSIGLEIE